jgi:hypothetical protein
VRWGGQRGGDGGVKRRTKLRNSVSNYFKPNFQIVSPGNPGCTLQSTGYLPGLRVKKYTRDQRRLL